MWSTMPVPWRTPIVGPESLEEQREIPPAELARAGRVAEPDGRDLLEDQRQVVDHDVGPQAAIGLRPLDDLLVEPLRAVGHLVELLIGRERPGEVHRDRHCLGVEQSLHERLEGRPRVALVGNRPLGLVEVLGEAVAGDLPEQVLLARIAQVEGADPHPGPSGHRGHRRIRVGREDLPRRLPDPTVVPPRLGAPAAQRAFDRSDAVVRFHPLQDSGSRP
jgi:hypothetical protein